MEPLQSFAGDLAKQLRTARSEGGVFEPPPRVVVRLSGHDAFRYLNGQVTRDLSRLVAGDSLPACLLTPKGKLCAPLLIRREGEDLLVETDPVLEEVLLARLDRYIVADEVTLSVEPSRKVLHFFGTMIPEESRNPASLIRVTRLGIPGWDCEPDESPEEPPPLQDPRVIETLRIERCIPAWGREMSEETLPPEVGLDLTHIDYDRGCYPGQEVISRLKSIGRVNRLLHALVSEPGATLRSGMTLLRADGKELGAITSAALQWDTGSWVAFAILPRGTAGASDGKETLFAFDPLTGEKRPISIVKVTGS